MTEAAIPFALVVVALVLYCAGRLRVPAGSARAREELSWREPAFVIAMLVLLFALEPPLDTAADTRLSAHMLQHVLLTAVVSPLLVLGAPWMQIWRGLPLALRRPLARWAVRSRTARGAGSGLRTLTRPLPAWLLFNVDFLGWHLPWLYELALRHQPVHDLEHASFLLFGVIFWMQVFDSPPLRRSLRGFGQIVYVVTAAMAGWVLALVLTVAVNPIYPSYAAVLGRRNAISDQQLAGGIMWIPAMIPFAAALFYFIWRWLAEQEADQAIADAAPGGGGSPVPPPAPQRHRPPRRRDVTRV